MPLITRRSSTRALPRVSVGRCGLIFENCAFVSQNWSRLIYASFSEAVNHATTLVPTLLWVQTLVQIGGDAAVMRARQADLCAASCSVGPKEPYMRYLILAAFATALSLGVNVSTADAHGYNWNRWHHYG